MELMKIVEIKKYNYDYQLTYPNFFTEFGGVLFRVVN